MRSSSAVLEDLLGEFAMRSRCRLHRLDEAMARRDYDVAVLDVHLKPQCVRFRRPAGGRGTPLCFATGYGSRGIPDRHCARPVLQKPFRPRS
jgi:hypothetical protein